MIEKWTIFISVFILFSFIGFLIYLLGSKRYKEEDSKSEMYKCGEFTLSDPEVHADNFYRIIKDNLKIKNLQKIHSGKLNEYLQWIISGGVIIILLLLVIL
jgi:hypothetical protein